MPMVLHASPVKRARASGGAVGALPAYLSGASSLAWIAVAANPNRVQDKLPSPIPGYSDFATSGSPFSYSGASVDQVSGELLIVSGGGHGDYQGNESYALNLKVDSPAWVRLTAPSTDVVIAARNRVAEYGTGDVTLGEPATNSDGIPLSFHNCNEQQWQNGRVWFTSQSATAVDSMAIPACFSFDRDMVGNTGLPLASPDNAAPWRFHGNWLNSNINYTGFGVSARDSVNEIVWGLAADRNTIWSLDTATGTAEASRMTVYTSQPSFSEPAWACCAPDLGILVSGKAGTRTLTIWDVSGATPSAYSQVTAPADIVYDEVGIGTTAGDTNFRPGYNAVYHAASQSILLFEPRRKPSGEIIQLRIPVSTGAYNHGGSWTVTERVTTNVSWTSTADITSYSRLNLLEDVGNGEPVLVCAPQIDQSTYVCRLGDLS